MMWLAFVGQVFELLETGMGAYEGNDCTVLHVACKLDDWVKGDRDGSSLLLVERCCAMFVPIIERQLRLLSS